MSALTGLVGAWQVDEFVKQGAMIDGVGMLERVPREARLDQEM